MSDVRRYRYLNEDCPKKPFFSSKPDFYKFSILLKNIVSEFLKMLKNYLKIE